MNWVQDLDLALLRLSNQTASNAAFDAIMPFLSGNQFFIPALIVAACVWLWKGGRRARLCVLMLALIIPVGDGYVCNTIKNSVLRPRPYVVEADIRQPASRRPPGATAAEDKPKRQDAKSASLKRHNSFPSSHAANWFAATIILFVYYRRSVWFMLPLSLLVSFSRLYNGAHYPTDVLAGAVLGAGYAAAGLWGLNWLWQQIGKRWFPVWWRRQPSLTTPSESSVPDQSAPKPEALESTRHKQWLRLGYFVIGALLLTRLIYIGSGVIQLSEDEAYQWVWSKHLALSYFSKPPMIAYAQFLGTNLWGDTELGVRFLSPVLAALGSLLLLHFFARHVSARAGFCLILIGATTPLLAVGSTLMTIDPLSVFFWLLAMLAGWRAVQPSSRTSDWVWTGLWMGLGFLSKYTELFQLLCWATFFLLWKPAREQLRRPGPYVALGINALCTLPVLIWNWQHDWITVSHVAGNAGLNKGWSPGVLDFLGQEFALLNPVYFIGALWAAVAFWKALRDNPLALYFFSMGAPLFLCYFVWSFRSRILPNWIAPSILPLFCLMILYWRARWPEVSQWARKAAVAGVTFGAFAVVLMHDTTLIAKLAGRPLPAKMDPMVRVRSWQDTAKVVTAAREQLQRATGEPVFIIGHHYGITGLLSFYMPEARTHVTETPLVYFVSAKRPRNQFYFWPGYQQTRPGRHAIYVRELSKPPLVEGWFGKWLKGEKDLSASQPESPPPPRILLEEFETVTDLGQFEVREKGRVLHIFQLLECRNLK